MLRPVPVTPDDLSASLLTVRPFDLFEELVEQANREIGRLLLPASLFDVDGDE